MSTERQEYEEPIEADGVDPEIDMKATEQAFFRDDQEQAGESRIRKLSETLIEVVEAAAEKIAQGSRNISEHVVEEGQAMASVIFGGEKGGK